MNRKFTEFSQLEFTIWVAGLRLIDAADESLTPAPYQMMGLEAVFGGATHCHKWAFKAAASAVRPAPLRFTPSSFRSADASTDGAAKRNQLANRARSLLTMETKNFKALFSAVAEQNGFTSAFGGWFAESPECIIALDLQKSNFGNYLELNLKIYVQGMFGNTYVKNKDLLKKSTGDVFTRPPDEFRDALDLGCPIEVDPKSWTGRIVNPNSEQRSQCQRSDVCTVPI